MKDDWTMLERSDDPNYISTDCGCENKDEKPKPKTPRNATITSSNIENPTEISKDQILKSYSEKSSIEQLIQLRDEVIETMKDQYKLMKMIFASTDKGKWSRFVNVLKGYHKSLDNVKNMIRVYQKKK